MLALGRVVATQGIMAMLRDRKTREAGFTDAYLHNCIDRHAGGDWGNVHHEDWKTNDEAAKDGDRILSAYPINTLLECKGWGNNTIWIITEYDRSVTTILLPEEY